MMQIQIKGLSSVRNMMNRLPKNIQKEVGEEGIMDLARNLQRRIKIRAPKDMGWLKRSVMVEKKEKQVNVVIHAFYAKAIEEGSRQHKIPEAYLGQHKTMPDAPGQFISGYRGPWVTVGGKARPFVKPAFDSLVPKIPALLTKYVEKAINKSRQK